MNNVVNQLPYLRVSREFPEEIHQLTVEINKSYVDTANAVNNRIISIFPTTRPAITGESWFLLGNQKQNGFRQVYNFTTTVDINIGFKLSNISIISPKTCGSFLSGTSWNGLIFGSDVAIAGQISFNVIVNALSTTSDIIRFYIGAGAPALTRGVIDLEWLSQP
jgi:hypothetical protein